MTESCVAAQIAKRRAMLVDGLALYRGLAGDPLVKSLNNLLKLLSDDSAGLAEILDAYHRFAAQTVTGNWPDCLFRAIIQDVNPFTRAAAIAGKTAIEPELLRLAARDLNIIQEISAIDAVTVKDIVKGRFADFVGATPDDDPLSLQSWPQWRNTVNFDRSTDDAAAGYNANVWLQTLQCRLKLAFGAVKRWGDAAQELAAYHRQTGYGVFAAYVAFRWGTAAAEPGLEGITHPDPFNFAQIIGLRRELDIITENTEHFVAGFTANNMILYGDRGTGKSSVIKALLHTYVEKGLRLIELPKSRLGDFNLLLEQLAGQKQRFIIFVDDLSFEETEQEYKALKTVLEGTLEVRPQNVVIYATSNRRHLVRESLSEREVNDLHARDGIQEKLSLADRFGITVTFTSPDQAQYLQIVEGLVEQRQLKIDKAELRKLALRWEMQYNGRSGRTARQFVDYLTAKYRKVLDA